MRIDNLEGIALALIAGGKGILAADETVPALTRRFDALGIKATEQSRRPVRRYVARARARTYRRTRGSDGRLAHDRALRAGHERDFA